MRDSERYMAQAEAVARMAARADNPAERQVYESIAEGWRKLAGEARRNERHDEPLSRLGGGIAPRRQTRSG
jgi:hypothetical protein